MVFYCVEINKDFPDWRSGFFGFRIIGIRIIIDGFVFEYGCNGEITKGILNLLVSSLGNGWWHVYIIMRYNFLF